MQSLNKQSSTDCPKELWWAHSPAFGWVVQDRSLFVNRCWDFTEDMTFIRCNDWSEYTQGEEIWNYKEAGRYLDTLSPGEAFHKRAELEELKSQYVQSMELAA